jgi:hypothetical protein
MHRRTIRDILLDDLTQFEINAQNRDAHGRAPHGKESCGASK